MLGDGAKHSGAQDRHERIDGDILLHRSGKGKNNLPIEFYDESSFADCSAK